MSENSGIHPDHQGNRLRTIAWMAAGALLLLPLIAMQFTDEVAWTLSDFAIFGVMIAIVGGTLELAVRKSSNPSYRAAAGVALAAAFLLVWINGAVGIIGSENNPANLLYAGVLGVAIVGTLLARFRPAAMSRAMIATAGAQILVAAIAVFSGSAPAASIWALDVLILTVFFAGLWLLSAWFFRKCQPAGSIPKS